jgi:O-antigen ligase
VTSNVRSPGLHWAGAAIGAPPGAWRLARRRSLPGIAGGAGAVLLGAAAALMLSQSADMPLGVALGCGFALLGVLALALVSYDAAVVLGLLLLGVVWMEPALPDAVLGVAMAVAAATGRFRLSAVPRPVRHLLGVLVALNLLSAIEVLDLGAAARFFAITLFLVVLAVWLAGYVDGHRRTRLAVGAYLVAAVSSALLGSLALFVSFPGSAALSADGYRAKALFEDPNVFGPFLVPAAVILLEERLRPRLFARRPTLNSVCLLVVSAGILFSYSRAAWLNLAVAVGVLILLAARGRGGARRTLRLAATGILAAAAAMALVQATGSADFLDQRAHYQTYDVERLRAQQTGIDLALAHPLGIGPGQFDVLVPVSAHSLYVRALAEQGILGLAVLLALVGGTLALAARNALRRRDLHGLSSFSLLAAWSGALVNSLVVDTLHWRHLWLLAALIWANAMVRGPVRSAGR